MPAKNSAGPRPHFTHCRASRAQGTPACAWIRVALTRSSVPNVPFMEITAPRTPPSRTRRLLPSPIHSVGAAAGSCLKNDDKSVTSRGVKKTSAGPPACHEVYLDMSASNTTRAPNSCEICAAVRRCIAPLMPRLPPRSYAQRRSCAGSRREPALELLRHGADVARAHGEHDIAVMQYAAQRL